MNVSKIAPNLHYCGKILKQGNNYYTGSFFKNLKSGKNLCLNYENGLLKNAVISNGEISSKSYDYDNNKRLINVKNNGKDVFVKVIRNKLGLKFRRTETINDNIYRVYDKDNNLLYNRILTKSLTSNFFRFFSKDLKTDVVKEDRYFITNLVQGANGNYYLKIDKGCPVEPDYEWFRTAYKIPKLKHYFIIDRDENKLSGRLIDGKGNIIANTSTLLDRSNRPMWEQISGRNGLSLDFKSMYSEDGAIEREMSVLNSKHYNTAVEKTFDEHRNIIKERCIERDNDGNIRDIFEFERKFDENDLMIEEIKYKKQNRVNVLLYKLKNEYNSKQLLIKSEYYNSKDELLSAEYNMYDDLGNLRLSGYKNYEKGIESGYDVYDKSGNLRKRVVFYKGESVEELYDKNGFNTKLIVKNADRKIKYKYKHFYDESSGKRVLTEKTDWNKKLLYKTEYFYKGEKEIRVYKDADGRLLGKQFIYVLDDDYNYIYTNAKGKRCSFEYLAKVLKDNDI